MFDASRSSSDKQVQLGRGASYLIIQSVGTNAIIPLAGFIILARLISTKEMGIWTILFLINATCVTFATLFPQAVTKFVAENASSGLKSQAAAVFYQALRANMVTYLPVVVVIYLGAPFLASRLLGDAAYAPLLQVLAFDLFFYGGMLPVITAAMLGLQMFREIAAIGLVVQGLLRQILILSLVILMHNFVGLLIGWLISDATAAIIYLTLAMRTLGAPRFDFSLTTLFRYHLPLELTQILGFAQNWFDRAFLMVFVPLATLGIYNAAVTASNILGYVGGAMMNVLFSAYSSIQGKGEYFINLRDPINLATRYTSFTLIPLGFGLLATAKPALALLVGESYVGGYLPLMIFSGAFALSAAFYPLGPVFLALGETRLIAFIAGVSLLAGIPVAYVLVPEYGIVGAAAASELVKVLSTILTVILLRRKITFQYDFVMIAKILLAGATMATIVAAVQLVNYSKFMLPSYVLVGATVYLIMLRFLKAVEIADVILLQRFLGKRLSLVGRIVSWMLLASDRRLAQD